MNKKNLIKDILFIWALYTFSIVVVYFMGSFVKYPYFILLLIVSFKSKKDYWWLAFYLFLFAQIGNLFPETSRFLGAYRRIPVYNLGFLRVPYYDMIVLSYLVKSLYKPKNNLIFKKNILVICVYVIVLYVLSIVIGMTADNHVRSIRSLFQFSLLFSLPRIIDTKESFYQFYNLLFSSIFIILVLTIIEIFTGFRLGNLSGEVFSFTMESKEIRIFNSPFLVINGLIVSMFLFFNKESTFFSKNYLSAVIVISNFLIIMTGTRGWFLSILTMGILTFYIFFNKTHKILSYFLPIVLIIYLVGVTVPEINKVIINITTRLSTIEELAEGDITAGGTLSRISVRMPRMLKKVKENPITGFGFSEEFYIYGDNHVGPVYQLLQMGIIGYLLFIWFFIVIYKKISYTVTITKNKSYYILFFGIIGLNVIHLTSTAIFGLTGMGGQRATVELLSYLLTFMSLFIKEEYSKFKHC